jgi:hypothetical protein
MGIILPVIGGFAGAALGAVAAFLVGALAAEVFQVSSFEGQAGYFVVFPFVLPGLLIGLVAGILLTLRSQRCRAASAGAGPAGVPGSTPGRFVAALAIIIAIVAGGFWLYGEAMDETVAGPNQATPKLSYELRLPPGIVLPASRRAVEIHLYTGKYEAYGNLDDDWRHMDGDRPKITGWFDLHFKTPDRALTVGFAKTASTENPVWVFKLKLPRTPGHMTEFSPWYPVDLVAEGIGDGPRKATAEDRAEIRYRLAFAGRD